MSLYELFLFAVLLTGAVVFLRKTLKCIDRKNSRRKVAL